VITLRGWNFAAALTLLFLAGAAIAPRARAQVPDIPGVTSNTEPAPKAESEKTAAAPTADNPEATVAESTGPIAVTDTVSDISVQRKLEKLLPRYPGVRSIEVEVEEGVVTLTGHVADPETRDRLRDFVRRVQGVNLVLNQTKTDAQVMSGRAFALKQLGEYGDIVSRKWLLFLFAILFIFAATTLARLFKRYSETILAPFTGNVLMRSILGSIIAVIIVVAGVLAALQLLGMTEAVLSFLGLAGVVALAVGFAFRDIAENFIASIMLGVRRPFRVGDFVEVAGHAGVVKTLNTRATVLVTLDGSQVRIPNATIFKEILVNTTASTSVRASFDVLIPWGSSIAVAFEAIETAIRAHEGLEDDPPPRTLVERIEAGNILLRTYFWFPARGVDRWKLLSDVQLAAKVALQKAGLGPVPPVMIVQFDQRNAPQPGSENARVGTPNGDRAVAQARADAKMKEDETRKIESNIRQDTDAANKAAAQLPGDQKNEIEHALDIAGKGIGDEGRNLIEHQKDE
jgi:small-conductance mechanosensitive channel